HHLGAGRLERLDRLVDVRIARDIDDQIDARIGDELTEIRGDWEIESAREVDARRPWIHVGDSRDGDGRITGEHLQEGTATPASTNDENRRHALSLSWRTAT